MPASPSEHAESADIEQRVAEWAKRSTRRSSVPERLEDETVAAKIAAILRAA